MNCPTCGKPGYNPPWKRARDAGFDPGKHCALMANAFGRVVPCVSIDKLGYFDCAGGECPIAARFTRIERDKYGREQEVFCDDPKLRVQSE